MSASKLALVGVLCIVGAAIGVGLFIIGSPAEQRQLRLDDRRTTDLQRISGAIGGYYRSTEMLPGDLEAIVNGWTSTGIPRDPESNLMYEYQSLSRSTYQLCAEFALDSRPNVRMEFFSHTAGRQCFSFDYSDMVLD